tara:strand:+ start:71 stop:550 length:480 start_codon:yes stop_codon:yes gene_type:complete
MNFKRSFKMCEEFYICCTQGGEGVVHVEKHEDNKTLYAIQAKGSGRCATIFSSDYIEGDEKQNNFGCMKQFIGKHVIFESYEPFIQYGFNTLSYDHDWDGKLVKESFDGDDRSWLICFKGNPIINGKELRVMDYAKLENKHYDVTLNDALVGVFTKCFF